MHELIELKEVSELPEDRFFCIYPHKYTWAYKEKKPGESAPLCNLATCQRKTVKSTVKEGKVIEVCHYRRLTDPNTATGAFDYKERNSYNLAHIYENELKIIHKGARPSLIFTYRNLRNLTENGLLKRVSRHRRVKLTDKAIRYLGLKESTADFYSYVNSPRYYCSKCGFNHYESSGIGKKHLEHKKL